MLFKRNDFKYNLFRFSKCFFNTPAQKMPVLDASPTDKKGEKVYDVHQVQPWVDVENRLSKLRNELVLSDQGKIDNYVLEAVKGYFRTTYKDGVTLESNLTDHGLDSIDAIELGMLLEDELGYIIEAETLPQFTKVKHYANYIKQMEAYKREYLVLPQIRAHQAEENWNDWIPGGDKLRSKLANLAKKEKSEKKEEKTKH